MRHHGMPPWVLIYLPFAGGLSKNRQTPDINIKLRVNLLGFF